MTRKSKPADRRKPRLRTRLLLALTVTFVTLLICEGLLQILVPAPIKSLGGGLRDTGIIVPDDQLGWRTLPNRNVQHKLANGSSVNVVTNSRGFRDAERTPGTGDRPRVVVAGDSFVFGFGVEADEMATTHLQAELPDAEIINLGVTGYNLAQTHKLLQLEAFRYRPEVVVLMVCQNDVAVQNIPVQAGRKQAGRKTGIKQWMSDHIRIYGLVANMIASNRTLRNACIRIGLKDSVPGFEALDENLRASLLEYPAPMQSDWDATTKELLAMKRTCDRNGAKLMVALAPAMQSVDRRSLLLTLAYVDYFEDDFDLEKPYRELSRLCVENGISCVWDLARFREAGGASLYVEADMHLNDDGNRLFGELIASGLRRLLP